MAVTLGDNNFTQLFTSTLQKYEKTLVDNVLLDHPVLEIFKKSAKSMTGRGLVVPLRAADLSATGYTDASGTHSTAVSADILGSAVYEWANTIITPFRIKHRDILQNAGPEQIVSLVEEYVKAASADHANFIVAEMHKPASAWAAGELYSLDMLIGDIASDTTAGITVGGINHSRKATTTRARAAGVATIGVATASSFFEVGDVVTVFDLPAAYNVSAARLTAVTSTTISYAIADTSTETTAAEVGGKVAKKGYWQSTRETIAKTGGGSQDIVQAFRTVTNDIYRNSRKRPDVAIVGFDVYEELEAYLVSKGQYQLLQGGQAQTRFTSVKFGDLEVRLDPDCQNDRAYFLTSDSLRFAYCAGEFMKAFPAQPIEGTLDTVVPLASSLTFGTVERRANGLLIRS
jgi:hypothetical protein